MQKELNEQIQLVKTTGIEEVIQTRVNEQLQSLTSNKDAKHYELAGH